MNAFEEIVKLFLEEDYWVKQFVRVTRITLVLLHVVQ